MHDLLASGGVAWHILDKTGNPNYMVDVQNGKKYMSDNLELNLFQNGKTARQWMHRYVTVFKKFHSIKKFNYMVACQSR